MFKRVNAKLEALADKLHKYVPEILYAAMAMYVMAQLTFCASRIGFGESPGLTVAYFICQDSGCAGFLVWLLIYLTGKPYRTLVLPVLINSILIFIWDIISYLTGLGVNHPVATGIGFGLAALIVTLFMVRDITGRIKKL